jgi:glycosyltransferase involved in cell wall biosynthesis
MSNAHKPKINLSVIIACLNGGKTLVTQLEALAGQVWREEWEVIIADNGSTDDSRQIIENFKAKIPNLRVIDAKKKKGAAYARNVAIREAQGDRLAFCDVDDRVGDGWISSIGEALGEFDVVVSQFDDELLNAQWLRDLWHDPTNGSAPVLGFMPAAAGYGLGLTRRVYTRVGELDESMTRMADIDYTWRIQLAGFKLHLLPHAVVHYRHRDTLKGMFKQAYYDGQAHVLLYKKYQNHGMPWESFSQSIRSWVKMVWRLPQLLTRLGRGKWVVDAGFALGHLRGSIKYGVVAL